MFEVNLLDPIYDYLGTDFYQSMLDSFRQYEIAKYIRKLRENFVDLLQRDFISEEAQAYFNEIEGCDLFLKAEPFSIDDFPSKTNAGFVKTADKLFYFNRSLASKLIELELTPVENILFNDIFNPENVRLDAEKTTIRLVHRLSPPQLRALFELTGHKHTEIAPFAHFEHQPNSIVQIKELINALYHTQRTFEDLEKIQQIKLNGASLKHIKMLMSSTINHAYKASHLITQLDYAKLGETFREELDFLKQIFSTIQTFAEGHKQQVEKLRTLLKESVGNPHSVGNAAGVLINQLQPSSGKVDYNFITKFSAEIPGYIQQLTQHMHEFTSNITAQEPTLDKKKLDALKEDAIKLLNSINSLQNNSAFLSIQLFHYIVIIRHIIGLSMTIYDQMSHMTETSQELIRSKLDILKYELLPQLFSTLDKAGEHAFLKPNTLSMPVMDFIEPYYKQLVEFTKKVVDFSEKGADLCTLNDNYFNDKRFARNRQRIRQSEQTIVKLELIQSAAIRFFDTLQAYAKKYAKLSDFPAELKSLLITEYGYIQSYIQKLDIDLHNIIVDRLTTDKADKKERWWGWNTIYATVTRQEAPDSLKCLLRQKTHIDHSIKSDIATKKFTIQSAKKIINNPENHTTILAHSPANNPFFYDEVAAIEHKGKIPKAFEVKKGKLATCIAGYGALSSEQHFSLMAYYQEKSEHLEIARHAFSQFLQKWDPYPKALHELTPNNIDTLKKLYYSFQPYFVSAFADDKDMKTLDQMIIASLSLPTPPIDFPVNKAAFYTRKEAFLEKMEKALEFTHSRQELFKEHALERYRRDIEGQTLALIPMDERTYHVFQSTQFSQAIADYSHSIFTLTEHLSPAVKAQLQPAKSSHLYHLMRNQGLNDESKKSNKKLAFGIPFPDLGLEEGEQVLNIKRIFNSLYYLEETWSELEQLSNKDSKPAYVLHLLKASGHIHGIYRLLQDLYHEPRFSLIALDLMSKFKHIKDVFLSHSQPYLDDGASINLDFPKNVQYPGIWYALQAFMILPEHIQAMASPRDLRESELNKIREKTQKMVINIERIIDSSNSYFKLIFELPTMYGLFTELREELKKLATTAHAGALVGIVELKANVFKNLLLKVDDLEQKLGLQAGLLSGPLNEILDALYQGLIEPLNMLSKTHLNLISDNSIHLQRQEENQKKRAIVSAMHHQTQAHFNALKKLNDALSEYNLIMGGGVALSPDSPTRQELTKKLESRYRKAHQYLLDTQAVVGVLAPDNAIDSVAETYIKTHIRDLSSISTLSAMTKRAISYHTGLLNTQKLELAIADEQDTYLSHFMTQQAQKNKAYTLNYVSETFDEYVTMFINQQTELIYVNVEFNDRLRIYLNSFKDSLVEKCINVENVRSTMKQLLQQQLDIFLAEFKNDYLQLDTTISAIHGFQEYVRHADELIKNEHSLIFENKKSLENKTEALNKLSTLAYDSKQTDIKKRLSTLRNLVDSAECFLPLKAHREDISPLTFIWLKRCFLFLLQALHLYTPEHEKKFNYLKSVVPTNNDGNKNDASEKKSLFFPFFDASKLTPPTNILTLEGDYPQPK